VKTLYKIIVLAGLALGLPACVSTMPMEVTSNNGPTNLVGEANCTRIFVFNIGDCSYDTAKKSVGITNVHHTDVQMANYIIFSKQKTLVYGTK
jgi:hypothetical protein